MCNLEFATAEEVKKHRMTSPRHFCCRGCDGVVEFYNVRHLRLHYHQEHCMQYCSICEHIFADVDACHAHMHEIHESCHSYLNYFSDPDLFRIHYMRCKKETLKSGEDTSKGKEETSQGKEETPKGKEETPKGKAESPKGKEETPKGKAETPKNKEETPKGEEETPKGKEETPKIKEETIPDAPKNGGDTPKVKEDTIPRSHYTTLGVSPRSSHEEIIKAAKVMRVMAHPDRLKRWGGLTEEQEKAIDANAVIVGQAADILSNPLLRAVYDMSLH